MSGRNERFVHFENVCKYYNNKTIIAADHVTFDIAEGEFVVIVGPSGAGKTTILNMLGGMDTCDEGVISLGDRVISGATKRQLTEYRRTDVGFVFQFYNLVQNLTALENVEIAAELCRDPLDAAETLRSVGLERPHGQFPGAALGRRAAACLDSARSREESASILLCDEPTGALDYNTGKAILKLLWDTCRELRKDCHCHHPQQRADEDGGQGHTRKERHRADD